MNWEQTIGLVITVLVMAVGLLGSVLPGLPSTPIVLVAAIGHRLYFGENSANNWILALLVGLTLLSLVLDYLASMFGAKKMGATWRGVLGAVLGAIVGLFFGIPGILLGPFVGAVLLELMGGQELQMATRAGIGAFIGVFLGAVGKLVCCIAMIALFLVSVISRTGETEVIPASPVLRSCRQSSKNEVIWDKPCLWARPLIRASPTDFSRRTT